MEAKELLEKHKEYFQCGETKNIDFRINALSKLKSNIKKYEAELIEAMKSDLGKCEFEAYVTEIGMVYEDINYTMKNLKSWAKVKRVRTPLTQLGGRSYIYSEPYGTVLIIAPWNYPFYLTMSPLVGAVSAGNCCVVKPSEYSKEVTSVISKIIKESFEEMHVSATTGGVEISTALLNEKFDYIFFTGSVPVGKIVMEAAAKNLTPVTLELGGKSPCIVDSSCDIDSAVKRIIWGKFVNCGQTCIAPDYVYVHSDIKESFLEKAGKCIIEFYGEDIKNNKDYGRIINKRQFNRLIKLIDSEKLYTGGYFHEDSLYLEPTIMSNVNWNDAIMEDEIFGPILPVMEYDDLDNTIKEINARPKPLALYVFSQNENVVNKVINSISFGGGCINDTLNHIASHNLPFGGVGNSGIGSYHGKQSFDLFSHQKSVLKKSKRIYLSLPLPPYKDKIKLIRKVLK